MINQSKMVVTRQLDQVVLHIIKHVLEKDNDMVVSFKEAGLHNIVDVMSMSDSHLKKVKFKNGDETTAPRITPAEESELMLIPSYLNWEQNNYATLPDNPVDLMHTATRARFLSFLDAQRIECSCFHSDDCEQEIGSSTATAPFKPLSFPAVARLVYQWKRNQCRHQNQHHHRPCLPLPPLQ